MSNSATISTRIDPKIKAGAAKVVEGLGLDLASVIRAFTTQIYLRRSIPLDLSYPEKDELNDESLQAIEWANDYDVSTSDRKIKNAEQLFSEIGL
ncbi:MAG: type II toxin-antitoxin system RelB/DinJ family antitoxin [Candidatus Ancillula sp.]|jgi:addiction module RelB/DinJ family antitoxin|nr:type II toxin-antitoxin system RelB/DinJ family antitoxin [Candidatus Ancillula sp.]